MLFFLYPRVTHLLAVLEFVEGLLIGLLVLRCSFILCKIWVPLERTSDVRLTFFQNSHVVYLSRAFRLGR